MVVPVAAAAAVAVAEVLELDIIAVEAVNEVIVLGNEVVSLLWSRQCRFFHLFLYYCWHFQCHAFYFCQRGFPWHLQLGYSKAELEGCVYIYNKKYVLMLKMMIYTLILMLVLCPHKCRLTSLEKKNLTTFMLIVMIMMKEN